MAKEAEELAAQAQRISELRNAKHVTQPEVADAIGVTLRGYQAWEAGHSDIKHVNLKKLAAYFGVSPDYIEYGDTAQARSETPEPFPASSAGDRLDRIEARLAEIERQLGALLGATGVDPAAQGHIADLVVKTLEKALDRRATEVGRRRPRPATATGR